MCLCKFLFPIVETLKGRNALDVGTKTLLIDANRTGFCYSWGRFNISRIADVISPHRRQALSEDTNVKEAMAPVKSNFIQGCKHFQKFYGTVQNTGRQNGDNMQAPH
jgi:hypothetical protein